MNMQQKKIYIIHGYQASSNDHWFPWLSQSIQQAGHISKRIVLPEPNRPEFQHWQQALHMQIRELDKNTIIVAHGLGCISVLHYLNQHFKNRGQKIKAGIFISGLKSKLPSRPELDDFIAQARLDSGLLQTKMPLSLQLLSSDDPYIPPPLALQFGHFINAQIHVVKEAGHFMRQDGFSEFPQLWTLLQPILVSG